MVQCYLNKKVHLCTYDIKNIFYWFTMNINYSTVSI